MKDWSVAKKVMVVDEVGELTCEAHVCLVFVHLRQCTAALRDT